MIRQYYNSVFGAPVPHSCLPCVHFATARSVKPHCKALGVRLPSMVHSSHDGSVSQLHALFWHHLYFSPHITKQPCVQLQRNALISVSGEAALHFSTGGLASLNNLPRNEHSLGMNTSVVSPLAVRIWTNLDFLALAEVLQPTQVRERPSQGCHAELPPDTGLAAP